MGQADIAQALVKAYPNYMTARELSIALGGNMNNVCRALRSMSKREEIEFMIIEGKNRYTKWVKMYRIRR